MLHSFLLSISLFLTQTALPDQKPLAEETTIFQSGEGGYQCYRIPSIVKAPNGNLLAFAEGRRKDGDDFGDIDIVMRTFGSVLMTVKAGRAARKFIAVRRRIPIWLFRKTATSALCTKRINMPKLSIPGFRTTGWSSKKTVI